VAEGRGTLAFSPADSQSSGLLVAATPSPDAVDVPVPAVTRHVDVVGEPRLELTYSGTAAALAGHLFAQIVDAGRNLVLGNQATPIAVTLDGAEHTSRGRWRASPRRSSRRRPIDSRSWAGRATTAWCAARARSTCDASA
jgi:hypothetical protein